MSGTIAVMLKGIIFDLGWTLIEREGEEAEVLARSKADLGDFLIGAGVPLEREAFGATFEAKLDEFHSQRLRDWVEVTTAFVLRETLAALSLLPLSDEVTAGAVKAFFSYSESRWRPVPGAHATLADLAGAGYRLGLISNAGDTANVERLIDGADLRRWFDPILISAAVGFRKPNPRIFEMALERMKVAAEEAAMVGDTLGADILGAQLIGMRNVWLARRSDAPANEAHRGNIQPEITINALEELAEALAVISEQ